MSMDDFPSSLRPVYVGGGLWLRVKVLALTEAIEGLEGLDAAVMIATKAATPDDERVTEGPMRGQSKRLQAETLRVMQGVCRQAVIAYAWSDEAKAAEAARTKSISEANGALRDAVAALDEGDEAGAEALQAERNRAVEAALSAFGPGAEPEQWSKLSIVANPQDENRERGKLCYATLDLVAPAWATHAGNVALEAGLKAAERAAPLLAAAK